jgi:20S proteasome alpha/beta subunit
MTICVGVAAPDGLILAADSRTTVMRPDGTGGLRPRIASDNAEKVFDVCGGYAVVTFGDAFIGSQTIAGMMSEFEATVDGEKLPVTTFADRLGDYFNNRYVTFRSSIGEPVQPHEIGHLGFLIAGYDDDGVGHICEVLIPDGKRTSATDITTTETGFAFRGMTDVINRLMRGVDWEAIGRAGITIEPQLAGDLDGVMYEINYPITLQDAIDLAVFFVRTTIDTQRFTDGIVATPGGWPGCGGPINIITVQQDRVEWVSQPVLQVRARGGQAEGAL